MATLEQDMQKTVANAATAHRLYEAAMMEFQAHCHARNWTEAEHARTRAIGHMESYLDCIASLHKRLEAADGKR